MDIIRCMGKANKIIYNKKDFVNSNSIPRQEIMVFIECQIDGIQKNKTFKIIL